MHGHHELASFPPYRGKMSTNVQLHTPHLTPLSRTEIMHKTKKNEGTIEGKHVAVPQDMIALIIELSAASQQCYIKSSSVGDSSNRP